MTAVAHVDPFETACEAVEDTLRRIPDEPEAAFDPGFIASLQIIRADDRQRYLGVLARLPWSVRNVLEGELSAIDRKVGTKSKPPAMPVLKSAADLMALEFTPIRWLIPGLLPEGLMLLAARPKVGKSWLALDVGIATATGGEVLGRRVERGDVLYLALEDGDRQDRAATARRGMRPRCCPSSRPARPAGQAERSALHRLRYKRAAPCRQPCRTILLWWSRSSRTSAGHALRPFGMELPHGLHLDRLDRQRVIPGGLVHVGLDLLPDTPP